MRVLAPTGTIGGSLKSWAAMMHHQTRWELVDTDYHFNSATTVLKTESVVPKLTISDALGDPLLAVGGQMLNGLGPGEVRGLRFWLLGKNRKFQDWVRALSAYSYGSEAGIDSRSPNVWGAQLTLWQIVVGFGGLIVAVAIFLLTFHIWVGPSIILIIAGIMIAVAGVRGLMTWMKWRSTPKEILQTRVSDTIFDTAITAYGSMPRDLSLVAGNTVWKPLKNEWPDITDHTIPLPALEIGAIIAPPEVGEGSGIFARDAVQEIPMPPPDKPLVENVRGLKVGTSAATGEDVKIDPDGHGMATGGSRSGKTSIAYNILAQLIAQGDDAPGILIADPHLSLTDAFLQTIAELPEPQRAKAIKRLRIITPDQPEVVPLNLLSLPEYPWAANALVQIGRRLWEDYWGPRMESVLIGLFRLAHVKNMSNPAGPQLGLVHTIFAAFEPAWRHSVLPYLAPYDRMTSLSLDALLGTKDDDSFNRTWVTEVISPVISKVNKLELSPWLFAAMHQNRFADVETWVREKSWIVLRLPSGEMGREGARLTAGVFYNVWDAVYRRVTQEAPIPYYIFVDEAQEIGPGMRLESMLAEGAKFGARMFVLLQSMSLMRKIEEMDAVVEALLANTSTQAFFTPSPEDAQTVRDMISSELRYGKVTPDLPTLVCWLRARIGGQWQKPVTTRIPPLRAPVRADVNGLIREVIAAHPNDYDDPGLWKDGAVQVLIDMLPPKVGAMLRPDYVPESEREKNKTSEEKAVEAAKAEKQKARDKGMDDLARSL